MFTQAFFEKHFKFHDKLVLFTKDNIKITFTKEPHYHMEGGHSRLDLMDLEDLTGFCNLRGLSDKPNDTKINV